MAGFDSASAMMRAVSCWLQKENFPNLGSHTKNDQLSQFFAKKVNLFPRKIAEKIFSFGGETITIETKIIQRLV